MNKTISEYRLYKIDFFCEPLIDCGVVPLHGSLPSVAGCLEIIRQQENEFEVQEYLYHICIDEFVKIYSNFNLHPNGLINRFVSLNEKNIVAAFGIYGDETDTFVLIKHEVVQKVAPVVSRECLMGEAVTKLSSLTSEQLTKLLDTINRS